MEYRLEHRQVVVRYDDMCAEVDEGIAPLILELWKAGLGTDNSCQDNVPTGYVWISFVSAAAAERFLRAVCRAESEMESMYNRIMDPDQDEPWLYHACVDDHYVGPDEEDTEIVRYVAEADIHLAMSVRFPATDYQTVLERMIEYNRQSLCKTRKPKL